MAGAVKFKHTQVSRQAGELARLKVVQGPDYGAIYVITAPKVTLGRGEENDVILSDLKASRRHAELVAGPSGWIAQDLGSANGIVHNGKTVRSATVRTGDMLLLGESTLEFMSAEVGTSLLNAPPKSMQQLQSEQSAFEAHKQRVLALARPGGALSQGFNVAGPASGGDSRRLLLLGGVLAVGAFLFLGDNQESGKGAKSSKPKPPTEVARDLASYLPDAGNSATEKASKTFFRTGFREYQAGNYLRAKVQFETVLQMSPGDPLAKLYLENCNNAIEDQVKVLLERGRKDAASGKTKTARGHYEAVLRLLHRNQSDASFIEAQEQLKKLQKESEDAG